MKKHIISFIVLIMLLLIPVGVYADIGDPGVGNEEFEYDGTEKFLELTGLPDDLDVNDIGWNLDTSQGSISATGESISIGKNVISGSYNVTLGVSGGALSGNFKIVARQMTIKPVDITQEFNKQTITASEYQIVSGSLVSGHTLKITYGGSNNGVGEKPSSISSYQIFDPTSADVTSNYDLTLLPGKLILTKPFEVVVDPEPQGQLAGPSTAYPRTSPRDANPTAAPNTTGTDTGTGTTAGNTAGTTDQAGMTEIPDGNVPGDSGGTINIPDNRPPLHNEANNALAIALFFAIFMVVAIIVIYLVARRRNRSRNGFY